MERICLHCEGPFSAPPCIVARGGGIFCSQACHYAYRRKPEQIAERFWARVNKNGPIPAHRPELGPCWVWTASKYKNGYGRFQFHNRVVGTHRVAWILTHGPLSDGYETCHHCDNPACVRPDHLFVGTSSDNAQDRERKGRGKSAGITHCPHGHEYTDENTHLYIDGHGRQCRRCRECGRIRAKQRTEYARNWQRRKRARLAMQAIG